MNSVTKSSPEKPKTKRIIAAICSVAVIAIFVILLMTIPGRSGREEAIQKCISVYKSPSVEAYGRLYPSEAWDYLFAVYSKLGKSYSNAEEMIENEILPEFIQDANAYSEKYGKDWSITYKITSAQDVSDEALPQIKSDLLRSLGISEESVSEAYEVSLSYRISGNEEKNGECAVTCVRIADDWYLIKDGYDGWTITVMEW